MKIVKMQNSSYTDQQKAQLKFQMAAGVGGTDIQRTFSPIIVCRLHRHVQSFFGTTVIETMVATLTAGNGRPGIGKEKREQINETFQTDLRRFLPEVGAVVGVHNTIVWHFSKKKLKMFP